MLLYTGKTLLVALCEHCKEKNIDIVFEKTKQELGISKTVLEKILLEDSEFLYVDEYLRLCQLVGSNYSYSSKILDEVKYDLDIEDEEVYAFFKIKEIDNLECFQFHDYVSTEFKNIDLQESFSRIKLSALKKLLEFQEKLL